MNQQPDKFFRDKLRGYEKPAPPNAWKRISENRSQRTRNFNWLKVAASILLLALAGILLFPPNTKEPVTEIAENTVPGNAPKSREENHIPGADDTTANEGQKKIHPSLPHNPHKDMGKKKSNAEIRKSKSPDKETTPISERSLPVVAEATTKAADETPDDENPEPPVGPDDLPARKAKKTITIVFSAEEVNEKYLTRKPAAEATPPAKETSALRKVLDKAYALKHNQDPLGDLRHMKNEILALNFRNDNPRNEN